MRRLPVLLLALALPEAAGCGGSAGRLPAPAFQVQEKYARTGARAWARGDVRAAIRAQQQALLTARTIEDTEGIALHILDLAALHRAAGDPEQALFALAELLAEPPPLAFPGRWRAEAARLSGLLALDGGDAGGGARHGARALELCRASRCPGEGAIVNLQARAALLGGDAAGAIALAEKGLHLNRPGRNDRERANSSRIRADAELLSGNWSAAADAYTTALTIDKKLGLDTKILLDLLGLGKALRGEGRSREARDYFERARAVARASGNAAAAAEAAAFIEPIAESDR